jgi:hypothetical protein
MFNARADDTHGDDMVAPTDDLLTDPYQYANVSRDEPTDDEQGDVLPSSTGGIPRDMPDSAPPPPSPAPPRRQRQAQHHLGVGLSAVVDSVGRRFSESGAPPTHSCINIAVEATAGHRLTTAPVVGVAPTKLAAVVNIICSQPFVVALT